jgi:hypothetical protein
MIADVEESTACTSLHSPDVFLVVRSINVQKLQEYMRRFESVVSVPVSVASERH